MPRSINKVQDVFLTFIIIFHLYGVALDCNATLTFQIHVVQHLPFRHLNGLGIFQKTVGQRRLAMVYMRYDTEISYMVHVMFMHNFVQS